MANKNNDKLYRVFDKKGKYHHSYSFTNKDSFGWAVDCASMVRGKVYEVGFDEFGKSNTSKLVFSAEEK